MIGKLLPRNTFLFALIVLFGTICILPMNLFADEVDTDHDNKSVNDVDAQTSLGVSYYDNDPDFVYCSAYANILNFSGIPVRYYLSASHSVLWKGRSLFRFKSDPKKGWVPAGEPKSFFPSLNIDMRGGKRGRYTANGDVSLELKFDFDGNGTFDEKIIFGSSASIDFRY